MAQVAAGLIAPEAAAHQVVRQVGEDLGSGNAPTAAEQLFQQFSAPSRSFDAEQQSENGVTETADRAFQVSAGLSRGAEYQVNQACQES